MSNVVCLHCGHVHNCGEQGATPTTASLPPLPPFPSIWAGTGSGSLPYTDGTVDK